MSNSIETQTSSFKYQPVRYFQSKVNFIPKVAQLLSPNCNLAKKNVAFTLNDNEHFKSMKCFFDNFIKHIEKSSSLDVYSIYLRNLYQLGIDNYDDDSFHSLYQEIQHDFVAFLQYASLNWNENNIFEFTDELLELFQKTDINDVFLKDIHLPFTTIYLHFGEIIGKELYGHITPIVYNSHQSKTHLSFSIDGAYVSQCPNDGSLIIMLTSLRNQESITNINNCVDSYEDVLLFHFDANDKNMTIKKIIDLKAQELFKEHKVFVEEQNGNYLSQSSKDKLLTKGKLMLNQITDYKIDVLKLIVNCILYLQSYPEDIEEDDYLHNTFVKAKGFGKATYNSKIQPDFKKIKFCGRKRQSFKHLDEQNIDEELLVGAGVDGKCLLTPHKRRAHLRKQRYGQGLQQWKFVWIRETTVHRDSFEPNQNFYRIYEVDNVTV